MKGLDNAEETDEPIPITVTCNKSKGEITLEIGGHNDVKILAKDRCNRVKKPFKEGANTDIRQSSLVFCSS